MGRTLAGGRPDHHSKTDACGVWDMAGLRAAPTTTRRTTTTEHTDDKRQSNNRLPPVRVRGGFGETLLTLTPDYITKGVSTMSALKPLKPINISDLEFVSLTQELRRFRMKIESEAGGIPLHTLEINPVDLLSDLCIHLRLGQRQHDEILGINNVRYLQVVHWQGSRPTVKH